MGKVMAVNISVKRGTQKVNVHTVKLIENYGLENDAHAGNWHRQVSLLSYEKIEEFKAKGAPVKDCAFGENLIVQGFDFKTLPVGTRLKCNDVILEITQIGKQCHNGCEIFNQFYSVHIDLLSSSFNTDVHCHHFSHNELPPYICTLYSTISY